MHLVPQSVPHSKLQPSTGLTDLLLQAKFEATKRSYKAQWKLWLDYCQSQVLDPLPADPVAVAEYLVMRGETGCSYATIQSSIAALNFAHEVNNLASPGQNTIVKTAMKGLSRKLQAGNQKQARPLDAESVATIRGHINGHADTHLKAAGLGEGSSGHSSRVGLAIRMTHKQAPVSAVCRQGRWSSARMVNRYTRNEQAGEALRYL